MKNGAPRDELKNSRGRGWAVTYLSRPISLLRTVRGSQPPRSKPLRGLNRAIVAL